MANETDEALARRASRGDVGAFDEIVVRHQDRLYTLALRITGSEADALDAVQDALVSAWRALPRFRGDARLSTWLYRIVVRKAYDAIERRGRPPADVPVETIPAAAEHADERLDILAALALLEPDFRVVAVLCDILGVGAEEASRVLGVPAGTVKSRLYRARARLAEGLGQEVTP